MCLNAQFSGRDVAGFNAVLAKAVKQPRPVSAIFEVNTQNERMRLTLLLSFLLFAAAAMSAQDGLRFEQTMIEQPVSAGEDFFKATTMVVNETGETIQVVWIREVNDLPDNWFSAVCDKNLCYTPPVDSQFFDMAPDESALLEVQLRTDAMVGDAQVTLRVARTDDRSVNAVATYTFPTVSSSSSAFTRGTRLYPNPGSNAFEIISDEPLREVTLTNMLGKVVRSYPAYLSQYDVSDLPDGIYLATLVSTDGRVVKTLRYSKRQVMP